MWEKPVASLTCLRPSLLPRRLRPRRRGRTCRERQRERRINRAGVAPAGVSAPPRLTWLRLALKRRGERRLAHGPTRTPLSPVGIHTPTQSTREELLQLPQAQTRHSTSGEARPGRDAPWQGRAGARRQEERAGASPGQPGGVAAGGCPVGRGRRGSGPDRPTCPCVLQRTGTCEEREQREGQGRERGRAAGERRPAELRRPRSPAGGSPKQKGAAPAPPAAAAALSMAATVGWQGKETGRCTIVARISLRA